VWVFFHFIIIIFKKKISGTFFTFWRVKGGMSFLKTC
jgi:hypothetical protein